MRAAPPPADKPSTGPGGGFALGASVANSNGTVVLLNTILACAATQTNVWGNITDSGFNICSDGSANFSSGSSFNFTDPKLLPLADNGGPTLTMALAPGSPAIDFGTSMGAPSTDQRGLPRPFGSGVEIGAFEAGPTTPQIRLRRLNGSIEISFEAAIGVSYELQSSSDLISWSTDETIVGTAGTVTRTVSTSDPARFYRLQLP